jgi:hypothetical protein
MGRIGNFRSGNFRSGSRFLLAERAPDELRPAGAATDLLVDPFWANDFLLAEFFEAVAFWLTVFVPAALPAADFFGGAFFLVATFLRLTVLAFFLVAVLFRDAVLRAAVFRAAAFLPVAAAFFRCLLAVFFAGIFNSCGTEKRRGLYMASPDREARFGPVLTGWRCPCRFAATIVLRGRFHYTTAYTLAPG